MEDELEVLTEKLIDIADLVSTASVPEWMRDKLLLLSAESIVIVAKVKRATKKRKE